MTEHCPICGISESIPSPDHDHRANFTYERYPGEYAEIEAAQGAAPLPPCPICGKPDLFIGTDGKPGCPHCEVAVRLPVEGAAPRAEGLPSVEALTAALAYADRTDDDPSRWYSGEVGYMDYEDHARAVLAGLSRPSDDPEEGQR